jgi:3',5'-cyclic AMP phosphodiesterase CpdA
MSGEGLGARVADREEVRVTHYADAPLIDPRCGDAEDDVASTKQRSLLAIAGSLLAEISVTKLLLAWTVSILLPGILLGLAPLLATAWFASVTTKIADLTELGAGLVLLAIITLGWVGWRPLFRTAENNFWSLNALAVQPGYAFCREGLRHLAEQIFARNSSPAQRARLRAVSSAGAGILLCSCAVVVGASAWPASRWVNTVADLVHVPRLILPTLANAVVLVTAYLAMASLAWGFADASMGQPIDLGAFDSEPSQGRTWRIAHLSDLHMVGERYGFRIESGRSGPRGNDRVAQVMARLEAIHCAHSLDLVLITGDMTDAGRSSEWAEFLDVVARHPVLAERMIVLPGNHDVNIVDRANPARLDLPFSPGKRLRQLRSLSAIATVQGDRVYVVDDHSGQLSGPLAQTLSRYRQQLATFADTGAIRLSARLGRLWDELFPMVLPPETIDGLGVLILNSNAETHFSFTNALGMVSAAQSRRLAAAVSQFPDACWIVALHHHLVEYPMAVAAFSERIGTALINGTWLIRQLKPFARRAIVMHGHRHIDWIGTCGEIKIVSAPSPVMGRKNGEGAHFHIHTIAAAPNGRLLLLQPERIELAGVS